MARERGRRGAAPRRPARRGDRAAALHRRDGHAREDDDVEHGRPRAARLRPRSRRTSSAARCRSTGSNAGWGTGQWVVVEADESDRSLLKLAPDVAVLTNAELDHHGTYGSRLDVDETFREFLARATEGVVVWDRPPAASAGAGRAGGARRGGGRPTTSPTRRSTPPAFVSRGAGSTCGCRSPARTTRSTPRRRWRRAGSPAPTPHGPPPLWRTSRARAAASSCSARPPPARGSTTTTPTIRRRSPPRSPRRARWRAGGVGSWPSSSRTSSRARARWRADFGVALAAADVVVVLDVYPARERAQDFPGVTGKLIAAAAADAAGGRTVAWLRGFDAAERVPARAAARRRRLPRYGGRRRRRPRPQAGGRYVRTDVPAR